MGKTIMIVDDAASVRQSVGATLQTAGYEVLEATDGRDALGKIASRAVDMFICDVNMPNMDGVTFLSTVKSDAAYASHRFAPFIMLTTESGADMKTRGKEAGAKAWIVKPFQPQQLLDAVKKLLV
ncbi:MAG TPA: response regulator [Spirochaetota bacterium]|nr:response regulator [Spirochaetota bacterium]